MRTVPLLGRWTGRAKVFTARRHPGFLARRLDALAAARGVVHVRVGHQQHAWTGRWPSGLRIEPQRLWTTVIDRACLARLDAAAAGLGEIGANDRRPRREFAITA